MALTTALGLPRQIAAFSAGYLFQFNIGVCLATAATTLGCYITYHISQLGLYDWVKRKYPQKVATIHAFLANATFTKALIIRLLPLGSNFITNIVAGATKTPVVPYVTGSFVGFIPQMILFTLLGSGLTISSENQMHLTMTLLAIALLLILMLYVKQKKTSK